MCGACRLSLLDRIGRAAGRSRREMLQYTAAVAALATTGGLAGGPAARAAQKPGRGATTVFHGGPIVTMDALRPDAEALAVRDGRILAVGRAVDVLAQAGADAQAIDLQGRAVLPGFIDPHLHIMNTALVSTWTDISPFVVQTLDAVLATLQRAVAAAAPGAWVLGFGYDPSLTPPYASLTFQQLDPLSSTNPIFILNLSGHLAYANAKAFALAGVTNQTPDTPGGGRYVKDANGQLTGEIAEPPAFDPFFAQLPMTPPQETLALAQRTLWQFQQAGCTTVNDEGVGLTGLNEFALLIGLAGAPDAPLRISGFAIYQFLEEVDAALQASPGGLPGVPTGLVESTSPAGTRIVRSTDDRFQIAGMKIWQDGSVQGYTAALREPYLNSTSRGFPNYTQAELTAAVQAVHDAGWLCSIHCNGDAAVEAALNAYESVLARSPRPDHRHRIEHCTVVGVEQLERIARLGLTVSFLNGHVYYWGEAFRERILGAPRAERLDPAAECVRLGIPFSFHCDSFTTPCQPLRYVQIAVTRAMRDSGAVLGPEQRISVAEALRAVTLAPAYQLFQEHEKGSLEVGKLADLVVLAQDPRVVPPDEIAAIEVVETWVGGARRQGPTS